MPNQVRLIKAHLDEEEERERRLTRPHWRSALPSPRPAAAAIAVTVLEVRAGVRPPWHLERVSHYSMWPFWDTFVDAAALDLQAAVARPLTVTLQEHTPGLVDATVVLQLAAGGVEPLSLRLDGARGRWELMELEYSAASVPDVPALDPPFPPARRLRDLGPRDHLIDEAMGIPFGLATRRQRHDPAWERHLPETPGIDLE